LPKIPKLTSSVLYKVGAREILEELSKTEAERFGDLARLSALRTTATLAHRLRELERIGFVIKSVHNEPGKPVHIFYSISEKGRRALELLRELENL
jgi:DNA-binding HxlR family transcriptional regulator